MTDERLAELERLCDCATPGPWVYDPGDSWPDVRDQDGNPIMDETRDGRPEGNSPGDMPFVAESRTAIPELIAEVRRYKTYHRLAREAILRIGYFKESEVGDDLAPRITELHIAHKAELKAASIDPRWHGSEDA